MKEYKQIFSFNGTDVEVSTGKIAPQSPGSIMLKMGGTVIYVSAAVSNEESEQDFFPLSVEYIEKMYARGAMLGGKYKKREGLPSDEAIIKARQVDHSIRSLFPKSFRKAVAVVITVMAYDDKYDPETLAVLGTSLALMQCGVPFSGPCASLVACVDSENKIIINPPVEDRDHLEAEFVVAAVDGKLLCLEGWGKEVTEETMDKLLDESLRIIAELNKQQREFIAQVGKTLDYSGVEYPNKPAPEALIDEVYAQKYNDIKAVMFKHDTKTERQQEGGLAEIKKQLTEEIVTAESEYKKHDVEMAVEYLARKALREGILQEDKRVSKRGLHEIREMYGEIDVLPTVHGSALFQRGLTQSLSIATLAPQSSELFIEDIEGESKKTFMHHYNMPAFANGETGRYNYHPNRREIGHGAIGENALRPMIPSTEDFPYTIRVVSEIMSSNGSTSMAATCAACMAMMAAGVPLKSPVAGIGVGLVTEDGNEDKYKLLLDIEGIEDFYGDMDFKVCGTLNGITAIQYENKLMGVKIDVIKEAFRLAKSGRAQVLDVMTKVIAEPRAEVPANAPKVEKIQINVDDIGALIGPGGKNIKELVAESGKYAKVDADIKIEDDGTVSIAAINAEQMNFVKNTILSMFKKAEVGDVFEGVVDKVMTYGLFIDVSKSISGLCHISEITDGYLSDLGSVFRQGDVVNVKVLKIEDGRLNFTMKGLEQFAEIKENLAKAAKPRDRKAE